MVRRIALAATVGDAIVPTIGLDMLRVASGAPVLVIRSSRSGVETVGRR